MTSKVLCTFPGRFGDILWALPTVRVISQCLAGEKVDFGIMPAYRSLLPFLNFQSYIGKAFVIENWECTGSPYGDQPWQPPRDVEKDYERSFHLGYKGHPGIHCPAMPLIDFTAHQQGFVLRDPIPFIEVPKSTYLTPGNPEITCHVAYAFSTGATEEKLRFMDIMIHMAGSHIAWVDVSKEEWLVSAALIKTAMCFVGSRSSNNVIAHGVGQKNIFIYEPEASRHASGQFGSVFGCPYDKEETQTLGMSPEQAAELACRTLAMWHEQPKEQETIQ